MPTFAFAKVIAIAVFLQPLAFAATCDGNPTSCKQEREETSLLQTNAVVQHGTAAQGSQQILANQQKQDSNAYNQSLSAAATGSCILPSAKDGGEGWVRFGAGKLAAIGGVPFVGVFLSARACQVAWNKNKDLKARRAAALEALKDKMGDEQPEICEDDEEAQDLVVLNCEVKQSNTGVGGCLLGFALSVASTTAAVCTAGASACITAPIAYGLEVATALNTCLQDSQHCGYTKYDPEAEKDDNALLTGKKIGKVRKFKKWMARTCVLPGFLK